MDNDEADDHPVDYADYGDGYDGDHICEEDEDFNCWLCRQERRREVVRRQGPNPRWSL